jgi:hypothetical protein
MTQRTPPETTALTAKVDATLDQPPRTLTRPPRGPHASTGARHHAWFRATGAAIDQGYLRYRAEDKSYAEVTKLSRQVPKQSGETDASAAREAGSGAVRWGRPPSSGG